jgi:hypothetical protein
MCVLFEQQVLQNPTLGHEPEEVVITPKEHMQPAKTWKSCVHAVLSDASETHGTHRLLNTWHVQQRIPENDDLAAEPSEGQSKCRRNSVMKLIL